MLDKSKRYLIVGLGLLGGKLRPASLTRAGYTVDGINRSEGHLQFALDHGYIRSGKTHDFEDLVQSADHSHLRALPHRHDRVVQNVRLPAQTRLHLHRCLRASKPGWWSPSRPCARTAWNLSPATPWRAGRLPAWSMPPRSTLPRPTSSLPRRKSNTPRRPCQCARAAGGGAGLQAHRAALTVQEHDKMIGYVSQLTPRHRRQPDVRQRQHFPV